MQYLTDYKRNNVFKKVYNSVPGAAGKKGLEKNKTRKKHPSRVEIARDTQWLLWVFLMIQRQVNEPGIMLGDTQSFVF